MQAAPALALIDETAARMGAHTLRGRVLGEVLGVLALSATIDPVSAVLDTVDAAHQVRSGEVSRVIVGSPEEVEAHPIELAGSLTDVRDALALARSVPGCFRQGPVLTITSMTMGLHLSRFSDGEVLDRTN